MFVPSLTRNRFPSSRTWKPRDCLVPRHLFSAARYEGSDADERRLFYVAMTRARDPGTPTIRPGNRHGRMRDGLVAHCPDRRDEVGE